MGLKTGGYFILRRRRRCGKSLTRIKNSRAQISGIQLAEMSAVCCTVIQGLSGQKDDWPALLQQIEQHLPNIRSTDVDGILAQLTLPLHTIGFAYML